LVENDGRIYLELPVEKEFARLLRLIVSGIASRMNFNLDAVDDLKIAVEEGFLAAMRHRVESPVQISFTPGPDALKIEFKGRIQAGSGEEHKHSDDFGNFILEAVVDDLKRVVSEAQFDLRLVKNV
jgi:serine/threonine-protein kinase RsbW